MLHSKLSDLDLHIVHADFCVYVLDHVDYTVPAALGLQMLLFSLPEELASMIFTCMALKLKLKQL